jgi:DNA-directed RNA polymerase specialized sigma24 family protein
LRSGEWTTELRLHVAECLDCSQALHLAEALGEEARRAEIHCNPPDPYWILQRSRRMAREIAMRRMTRLLAVMRALAAVYVVAAAVWLLRGYAALQYREVASAMHGSASMFALMGAMVAAAFVVVGLWPILRQSDERG